jgi:hypothetical protein
MGVAISDFYICGVVAALHSSRMLHYCVQTVQGSSKIVSRSLAVGVAERSHIEDLREIDVTSVLPQSATVLQKPLHVQGQNWRETLDEQLLRGVPEHWLLFSFIGRLPFRS